MRQIGIRAQWVKPWIATTQHSNFGEELQNILQEQFNPDTPNAVWCSDITYIWTVNGFVYLTSIMDLMYLVSSRQLRKQKNGETLRAHYLFIPIAVANTWQMSTRKQRRKCNVVILKKRILGIMPALNHFMP